MSWQLSSRFSVSPTSSLVSTGEVSRAVHVSDVAAVAHPGAWGQGTRIKDGISIKETQASWQCPKPVEENGKINLIEIRRRIQSYRTLFSAGLYEVVVITHRTRFL